VSRSQPPPVDFNPKTSGTVGDDTFRRTVAAFGGLVERVTPWLLDLGSWIFGALTAFNLVILGALLTVGPADGAVLVSTAAFALALPADVAGFFLLRLMEDVKNVDLEEVAAKAFQEVGFNVEDDARAATPPESVEKRRTRIVLTYSYGLLALAVLLTLIGITAALWHMAWWIGILFIPMVILSQGMVFKAIASAGSNRTWRSPTGAKEPRGSSGRHRS
jgi:hypothetical protein